MLTYNFDSVAVNSLMLFEVNKNKNGILILNFETKIIGLALVT